jgi:hypothetical protein
MSVGIQQSTLPNVVEIDLRDKLSKEDYNLFVPQIEERIRLHGKIRLLVQMHDFHGWTAGGLWEDVKFDVKHFNHFERIALVGEKRWEAAMGAVCKPFTSATVRFFELSQLEAARAWLQSA